MGLWPTLAAAAWKPAPENTHWWWAGCGAGFWFGVVANVIFACNSGLSPLKLGVPDAPWAWAEVGIVEIPDDQRTSTSSDLKDLDMPGGTLC